MRAGRSHASSGMVLAIWNRFLSSFTWLNPARRVWLQNSNERACLAEDEMVTVAGSYSATAPLSSSGAWGMQMVGFRTPSASQGSVALSALSCSSGSMTGAGTDVCTVALTSGAPSGLLTVSLSSNKSAVSVPGSVTVPAGATSAGFTATISAVTTAQIATVTASAGGVVETYTINLGAAGPALTLSATNVPFGNVDLNTPATQSVTLNSSGGAALTIAQAA